MSNRPWYADGLRFRCTGCGGCCTGAPGHVWVNQGEIEAIAALVGLDAEQFEARFVRRVGLRKSLVELPGGDCVFFDPTARRCAIYRRRPRQCRTWPFWASNLRSPEAWGETARHCPGMGRGRLVRLERIEQLAGVVYV
jgi:uncharacterized protein